MRPQRTSGTKAPGLASSSAMFMASQLAANAGYFIAVLLLAHWLTQAERGTVAFGTISILMLSRLVRLGIPEAAVVIAAAQPAARRTLLTNQVTFAVAGSTLIAISVVGSFVLSGLHPAAATTTFMVVIGVGTVVNAIHESVTAFLTGCARFRLVTSLSLIQPWGWVLGLIAVRGLSSMDATAVVFLWTLPLAAAGTVAVFEAMRGTGLAVPDRAAFREEIRFGFPAWVGGMSTFVNYRFDQVLMGFISTRAQLGIYAVGVNASEVLLYLGNAIGSALTPVAARDGAAVAGGRTLRVFRVVTLITLATTLLAVTTGPLLLPLVFGEQYRPSIGPFVVLAIGAIGWTASVVLSSSLLGVGASKLSSVGSVMALVATVFLDVLLIPRYGAMGAAIATSCGFFSAGAAAIIGFERRFRFSPREYLPRIDDLRTIQALAASTFAAVRRRRLLPPTA